MARHRAKPGTCSRKWLQTRRLSPKFRCYASLEIDACEIVAHGVRVPLDAGDRLEVAQIQAVVPHLTHDRGADRALGGELGGVEQRGADVPTKRGEASATCVEHLQHGLAAEIGAPETCGRAMERRCLVHVGAAGSTA